MSHLNGSSSHKYQVRSNYNRVTQKGQLTLIFLFSPPCCIPQRPRSRNRALVLRYFLPSLLLWSFAFPNSNSPSRLRRIGTRKRFEERCRQMFTRPHPNSRRECRLCTATTSTTRVPTQFVALTTKQLHASLYTTAKSSDFGRILRYLNRQRAKRSTCIHALETIVRAAAAHEAQLRKGNDYTA